MKRTTLHTKFMLSTAFLTIFLGFSIMIIITVVYRSELSAELRHKGLSIGKLLSLRLIDPIMTENIAGLHQIIQDVKSADEDISYIFIVRPDGNEVIAHTFSRGFPVDLLKANPLPPQTEKNIRMLDTEEGIIQDIALPIISGTAGSVHIGVSEGSIRKMLNKSTFTLLTVTLLALVFGLMLFYILVSQTVQPISEMTKAAEAIGEGNLSVKIEVNTSDEIGTLAATLNRMTAKLRDAYDNIKTTQKQLDRASRLASLGQFTAGIAHEINNPLGGMLLITRQLLKEPAFKTTEREQIEIVMRGLTQVESTIKQLLCFADQRPIPPQPTPVNKLINEAITLFQHRLNEQSVKLITELSDNVCEIMAEPFQLQQVFINVIKNALDAMPQGGELFISLRDNEDGTIRIKIKDTGAGISEEILGRLFEPFCTTKEVGKGIGLGLFVSYTIIKKHQGDIKMASKKGEGATVDITLPKYAGA